MSVDALKIEGLARRLGDRLVLDQLDLDIAPGEFVALLGRSGSGKTTLLRALAGLDPAEAKRAEIPRPATVMFQEHRLMPWKTVLENVRLGLRVPDAEPIARAALAEVGLAGRENAWPTELSGGEAQRVALARALVREPRLLLLDEPFASLDALTRRQMQGLVLDLWRKHQPSVLLVTHDVWEAIMLSDRVLVLDSGRIAHEAAVPGSRPRWRADPELAALEVDLLARLGVEQSKN